MDEFLGWCVDIFQMMLMVMHYMEIVEGVSVLTFFIGLFVLGAVINAFLLRSH